MNVDSELRCGNPGMQQPFRATQFFPFTGGPITRGLPDEMSNGAAR